jgi:hypothetical protein
MRATALAPVMLMAFVLVLNVTGVVSDRLYFAVVFAVVGYSAGMMHSAMIESERMRRRAKREVESFVAFGHDTLEADDGPGDLDDHQRLVLERSMTEAIAFLHMLDKAAPPWVRWRDRRRRRAAS